MAKGKENKKEKKEKDDSKKKSKKKIKAKLPPEFALGARVEIIDHDVASMIARRGVSLGTFKIDTDTQKLLIAVKLEGPVVKGSSVNTSVVSSVEHTRQRSFLGTIKGNQEKPTAHIAADDLRIISAAGKDNDADALKKGKAGKFWFTSMFGVMVGTLLRGIRAKRRISPFQPPKPKVGKKGNKKGSQEVAKAEPFLPPAPASTEVGFILHETFDYEAARRYEQVIVDSRGYYTLAMARAMTPELFREICLVAGMSRADMLRMREELAPVEYSSRELFPLFAPF